MIFSERRYTLFRIMLQVTVRTTTLERKRNDWRGSNVLSNMRLALAPTGAA
jgi:hypothetical protein